MASREHAKGIGTCAKVVNSLESKDEQ